MSDVLPWNHNLIYRKGIFLKRTFPRGYIWNIYSSTMFLLKLSIPNDQCKEFVDIFKVRALVPVARETFVLRECTEVSYSYELFLLKYWNLKTWPFQWLDDPIKCFLQTPSLWMRLPRLRLGWVLMQLCCRPDAVGCRSSSSGAARAALLPGRNSTGKAWARPYLSMSRDQFLGATLS